MNMLNTNLQLAFILEAKKKGASSVIDPVRTRTAKQALGTFGSTPGPMPRCARMMASSSTKVW